LSAWVTILKEEPEMKTESTNLEAQLLNAVANEDYELASKLRDSIRTLEYA
jgi:protein-arginine kinase activator protein McsA